MAQSLDLKGRTFGRLTVLKRVANTPAGKTKWLCRCECGNEATVTGSNMINGFTNSCGCLRDGLSKKHGMHDTPEYKAYYGILRRCTNPAFKHYRHYGGRGILNRFDSFEAFYAEVGNRPGAGYEIDRIDNNGHYEPGNVRWVTKAENNRNRRDNVFITYNGVTKCVADWAKDYGITGAVLGARLKIGWSVDKALTEPVKSSS
jgi:hypothetical protein